MDAACGAPGGFDVAGPRLRSGNGSLGAAARDVVGDAVGDLRGPRANLQDAFVARPGSAVLFQHLEHLPYPRVFHAAMLDVLGDEVEGSVKITRLGPRLSDMKQGVRLFVVVFAAFG